MNQTENFSNRRTVPPDEGIIIIKDGAVPYMDSRAEKFFPGGSQGDGFFPSLPPDVADAVKNLREGETFRTEISIGGMPIALNASGAPGLTVVTVQSSAADADGRHIPSVLADIFHDLNMPPTIILSTLNLLSKRLDVSDPKIKQYLSIINNNCYRMMRISGNALVLSGGIRSNGQIFTQSVDLNDFLWKFVDSIAPFAAFLNVPVTYEGPAGSVPLNVDPGLLERLLLNLISNSMQFTRDGNFIKITLLKDDESVSISVADHGAGIHPDLIGELFSQTPGRFVHARPGHGIGLLICSTIAELHSGKMSVQSEYGKGTTFTLTLPVKKSQDSTLSAFTSPYISLGGFKQPLVEFSALLSSSPEATYGL